MGRKKIRIEPIVHGPTRRTTFEKRRIGLLKKAMELSILCQSTVSVTIYTPESEVYVYSSEPYENVVQQFQNYRGTYRLLTNQHLNDLTPGKSSSSNVGVNIIKQPIANPEINNIVMPRIQTTETRFAPSSNNMLSHSHENNSSHVSTAEISLSPAYFHPVSAVYGSRMFGARQRRASCPNLHTYQAQTMQTMHNNQQQTAELQTNTQKEDSMDGSDDNDDNDEIMVSMFNQDTAVTSNFSVTQ